MKFIDLFAGIGGFRYGLEICNGNWKTKQEPKRAGTFKSSISNAEKSSRHIGNKPDNIGRGNRGKIFNCVYSNEWDKYASSIYKKHYGECDTRDITKVPSSDIPDHDLLVGGFPCQSFSIAGKRRGFDDTRGTLFFEIARILHDKRPRYFLLENVKGLLSHDEGKTFQTILGVLTNLGYEFEWQVLNSKNFGVPQNRERVFIVGHLRGTPRPKVFPITANSREDDGINPPTRTPENEIASTLTVEYAKNQHGNQYVAEENIKIRRLTPTECERLQGFPDGWTEGISDTQRYKCLGNAVTTNVVTAIGELLSV